MLSEIVSISGKGSESLPGSSSSSESSIPLREQKPENEKRTINMSEMETIAADMQKALELNYNVNLHFSVHKASGQVMVVVSDKESGKIIREIPSSEILNIASKLKEMMGLLFDQKV